MVASIAVAERDELAGTGALLVRAWLATALSDFLFSSVLSAFFYGSTFARLWKGVASVLAGPSALSGGAPFIALGLAMHLTVAFTWSATFLFLVMRSAVVRSALHSPLGTIGVAAVYGPCIWMTMSLLVIPTLTHKPPSITFRWWVQFFGHMVFVALPMVGSIALGLAKRRAGSRAVHFA